MMIAPPIGKRCSYITIFINIYATLKLVPYSIKWNPDNNLFVIKSSYFQKACCALLHFLGFYYSIFFVARPLKQLQEKDGQNIYNNFQFVEKLACFGLFFFMVHFLWRWRDPILDLINDTHQFTLDTSKRQYFFIISLFFIHFFAYRLLGTGISNAKHEGDVASEYLLKVLQDYSEIASPNKAMLTHCLSLIVKYATAITLVITSAFYMFQHGLIICILLTLWHIWKAHKVYFRQHELQFDTGVALYCAMKRYLTQVNFLIETPMLLIYLTNLTFFVRIPSLLNYEFYSKMEYLIEQVNTIVYLFYTLLMWILSAQIHYEVEIQGTIKSWVYDFHLNGKRIVSLEDRMKLISLQNQVNSESENMGVSCKVFTITYSTFNSMVGIIVSYAILVYGLIPQVK